eukprot:1187490-Prorocentrum_minimum.AAC.3
MSFARAPAGLHGRMQEYDLAIPGSVRAWRKDFDRERQKKLNVFFVQHLKDLNKGVGIAGKSKWHGQVSSEWYGETSAV